MGVNRQFIGWDKPPLLEFSRLLREEICPDRSFDDLLVWVPSSRAARHLENSLFLDTANVEALHPPTCVTPAQYFRRLAEKEQVASQSQCLFAWKQAIHKTHSHEIDAIFPGIKAFPGDEWAYEIAQQLAELRSRLIEENLTFAGIADSGELHDPQRWNALKAIETGYLKQLASENLYDPAEYVTGRLDAISAAFTYKRLILAGILNLSRRQQSFVERLEAAGIPVDIYIPCDPEHSDRFDTFGRPLKECWINRAIPGELLEQVVQRVPSPREPINEIIDLTNSYPPEFDTLVVGCPDDANTDYLINRGKLSRCDYYSPEGTAFINTAWGRLVTAVLEWKKDQDLDTLTGLLNHTLFRRWVEDSGMDAAMVQLSINELRKEHLFSCHEQLRDPNLGPIAAVGTVRRLIDKVDELLELRNGHTLAACVWEFIQRIACLIDPGDDLRLLFRQLEKILQQLNEDSLSANIPFADQLRLFQIVLRTAVFYPDRTAEQRPVVGWLELPWEIAPHLVVLGVPDSKIPGAFATDTFLNPSLCRRLELYGPEEEQAFHAFRLHLILHSRKSWGRVNLILNDRDLNGDPVLPSRFLFQSDRTESLERIDLLLGERNYGQPVYASEFGAHLYIPEPRTLRKMPVTGFAAYLRDPFAFLLERRFRWEAPQPGLLEMDAMMFGNLAHGVLQALNSTDCGRTLRDAGEIFRFLENEVEHQMLMLFGRDLSVPLMIQKHSLTERLRAAAGIIASERESGWFPHKVEWAFHNDFELVIEDVLLRGKIDLLEMNEASGEYRIVDYKTSEKSESPDKTHLHRLNASSAAPLLPETDFIIGKNHYRWKDLQLPLYQIAVERFIGTRPRTAYLCMGKAVSDIGLHEWSPGREQITAAENCAAAIIRSIRAGHFPVPDKLSRYDNWAGWFGSNYNRTIDPGWINTHAKGIST